MGQHVRRRAGRCALSAAAPAMLAGCASVLDPAGPVGRDTATITIDATIIMLVIVVPTIAMAFWMAWRYRASNTKATYLPYWSFSGRIEAVTWAIPILTIMFLGGVIWIGSYRLDPFRPLPSKTPPLQVEVVSLDWKWLFIYPQQGVATVNQLVLPAATPVTFRITSSSVFNVFFVPRLGSMIYAMPGMVSQLNLQSDNPGQQLWGTSAQFSGDGFSDMQFPVKTVSAADFQTWAAGVKGAGRPLDRPAYLALMQQSQHDTPSTYATVDPQLFQAIATQQIPPGPGPQPAAPAHAGREVSTGSGGKD